VIEILLISKKLNKSKRLSTLLGNEWRMWCNKFNFPLFHNKCQSLLKPIVEQVLDLYENVYDIVSVIGIDGSPACGVNYSCTETEVGKSARTMI
jgi:predicted secreted protein